MAKALISIICRRFSSVVAAVALATTLSLSAWGLELHEIAGGRHSFRQLGRAYFVEVPMRRIRGKPRVVLFNERLARQLGLSVSDMEKLKKDLLDAYAREVDPTGRSRSKMIATRYQDSASRALGEALGDGRAVWAGEVTVPDPLRPGAREILDVVLKGMGQTPLAWVNHEDPSHSDGRQTLEEAVHSFIHSEANHLNGLDTTVDLAVIEVPGKTAITVRVGKQTRLAHLRYFDDEPEEFAKLFNYIIRRELGLGANAAVGAGEVRQYLERYTANLAHEAARYYDLHAVHGSPTAGNRTTAGGTIDMGTFRYLDAHHSDYSYLGGRKKLGGEASQTRQIRNYLLALLYHAEMAGYPLPGDVEALQAQLLEQFARTYDDVTARLALHRLGLPPETVNELPPRVRQGFGEAVRALNEAQGVAKVTTLKGEMHPAGFDTRKVLAEALSVYRHPDLERAPHWAGVFESDRAWAAEGARDGRQLASRFIAATDVVVSALRPSAEELRRWSARGREIGSKARQAPGPAFYYGNEKYALSRDVLEAIRKGESLEAVNAKALKAIDGLVDPHPWPRSASRELRCLTRAVQRLL